MEAITTTARAAEEWQPGDELRLAALPGRLVIALSAVALSAATGLLVWAIRLTARGSAPQALWTATVVLAAAGVLALRGLTQVTPGEAVIVQLFGRYLGSIREPGLHWVIPWAARRRVPVRLRSHETPVS